MIEQRNSIRSVFSRLGWGLTVFLALSTIAQFLMAYVPQWVLSKENPLNESETWMWLTSILPMYLIGFPGLYLIIRKVPVAERPRQKLGAKRFWTLLPICFFMMYAGNMIGNLIALFFGRGMDDNFVQELIVSTSNPLKYLALLVVAPVMEELTFRKLLLDRVIPYGEKTAVVLSGILFGLFHQNLYQFFYAFGVGIVLAYVYVRTGRIRYSMIMHFIINVFGGVIAPFMMELSQGMLEMNPTAMEAAAIIKMLLTSLLSLAISGVIMGLFISGIVLFCLRVKKTHWEETTLQLPKSEVFRTVYGNAGMVLFIVLCCAMAVLSHVLQW